MISKKIFKILSILSLILFYIIILLGALTITMEGLQVWKPKCCGLEEFEPIFGYIDIHFHQSPDLFNNQAFRMLSFIGTVITFLLIILFLWYMHHLLKNIHKDSLFMYENVAILFKLGVVIIVLGTAYTYMDGLLLMKTIDALNISNADVRFSNLSYFDTATIGIILIIIAAALKRAVHAVEENKKTI